MAVRLASALLLLAAVPVLAAWGGEVSGVLDSIGLLLPPALAAVALAALVAGRAGRPVLVSAALALGIAGLAALSPMLSLPTGPLSGSGAGPDEARARRLIQHNLSFRNPAPRIADRVEGADLATFQEVTARHRAEIDDLAASGWSVGYCGFAAVGGTVVASREHATASGCLESGASWMRIGRGAAAVTLVSIHLHWPWPYGQRAQVNRLLPQLRALERPVVVAGDFNQSPWSGSVARIARATGTRVLPGHRATLEKAGGLLRLPIDHVLVPEDWSGSVDAMELGGSDHLALHARIGPGER